MLYFYCALVVVLCTNFVNGSGIGTKLVRNAGLNIDLPMSQAAAESAGYYAYGECDPLRGQPYAYGKKGPQKSNSMTIYYTAKGQVSGVGMRMWTSQDYPTIGEYWLLAADQSGASNGEKAYDSAGVIFRDDSSSLCSDDVPTFAEPIGDRAVIPNQMKIALTMDDALEALWIQGDCINHMGIHMFQDLKTPGTNSWDAGELMPIVTMYDATSRALNAVFFTVPESEHYEPLGIWELPLTNSLMCLNWCKADKCTFPGVSLWSTLHLFFNDPNTYNCADYECPN